MFVELHMVQNMAPSNLNRDDTNNPKDCEFGGVRRARISSQCIKRAIRHSPAFAQATGVDTATRTRWLMRLLGERLVGAGRTETEVAAIVPAFVETYLSKLDRDGERTAVLLYLSNAEVTSMVQGLMDNWQALVDEDPRNKAIDGLAKALSKSHRGHTSAPDIALFGRMLAEKPELGLEAACQVAHAISTHRVSMEMDFFTAVDDLQAQEEPGAGMMGFTAFDSACFYRYARIDWGQLVKNLAKDANLAKRTVEGFLRAAISAVPTGKQNTFAAYNPPSLALAVVRSDGMGWSLANAFEKPVRPGYDTGLVAPSVAALDAYWGRMCQVYGTQSLVCLAALPLEPDLPLQALKPARVSNVEDWVNSVIGALPAGEEDG